MHTGRDPNGILQTRCAGLEKCGIAPGPTSVPLPVGSVLSAPKLHWEPSPPTRFSTALLHLCFYQHKDQRLHLDSLLRVTIKTSFIRGCHFLGLQCGLFERSLWGTSFCLIQRRPWGAGKEYSGDCVQAALSFSSHQCYNSSVPAVA